MRPRPSGTFTSESEDVPLETDEGRVLIVQYAERVLTPSEYERVQGNPTAMLQAVRNREHLSAMRSPAYHGTDQADALAMSFSGGEIRPFPVSAERSSASQMNEIMQRARERMAGLYAGLLPDRTRVAEYEPEVEPLAEAPTWMGEGPAPSFSSHFDLPTEHVEERPADATVGPVVPDLDGAESDPALPEPVRLYGSSQLHDED